MTDSNTNLQTLKTTLELFFVLDRIRDGQSLASLNEISIPSLCLLLETSTTKGIQSSSLNVRQQNFGKNEGFKPERESIIKIIWNSLQDTVIQILICAAFLSLIIGTVQDTESGWIEGLAILVAVLIVVTVTTANDYSKDGKFLKLSNSVSLHQVIVTRDGREQEIRSLDLVVGDLLHVNPGEVLEVDGVLVKSFQLRVDQSSITGESHWIEKASLHESQTSADPFLVSGSKIIQGSGSMIVCCVGLSTVNEKIRSQAGAKTEDEQTPLQEKLEDMAWFLGKIGLAAGVFMTMVLVAYIGFEAIQEEEWTHDDTSGIVSAFIIGITILVIAIPEGLPLAVTLSMAYSVIQMKDEKIFVRHIRGCEVMGAATCILTDKTGTLTENKMKVVSSWLFGQSFGQEDVKRLKEPEKEMICKVISRNTTAFFKDTGGVVETSGSKTESALINLVKTLEKDLYMFRDLDLEINKFAFNSKDKKMTTVYKVDDISAEAYSKGAGEVILALCSYFFNQNLEACPLNDEKRQEIHEIIESMSKNQLRVLALSIKTLPISSSNSQKDYESNCTFIGILGIKDSLRKDAKRTVVQVQNSGLTIRMVTGDNLETAVSIAKLTNILPDPLSKSQESLSVMLGKDFHSKTGGLSYEKDEKGQVTQIKLVSPEQFRSTVKYLKVLARCSPEDKLLLTVGLKEIGEVVAVIGDGSNDAGALKQSNLGIAMMSGTQLAKQSSDIILLDDNFYNVLNSIKWGRNVYACTRKFLQFQLTLNVVALTVSIVGGITVRTAPITAVQMLWVNLIQDSLAALALATEPPSDLLLNTLPYGRHERIISRDMIVSIASQSTYQITVLLMVLYLGPSVFDVDPGWEDDDWSQENGKHFTLLFHVFVLFQIFNEINCRKVLLSEINIFKNFFNNWMFHLIFWSTLLVQMIMIQFGGHFMRCSQLSLSEHISCLVLSSTCLIFAVITRLAVTSCRENQDDRNALSNKRSSDQRYSGETESLLNNSDN